MKYKARIQNNKTSEIRVQDMGDILWNEFSHFWWTDGNFGCDCNRFLEFERAAGHNPSLQDAHCGNTRFKVLDVELENGDVMRIDE